MGTLRKEGITPLIIRTNMIHIAAKVILLFYTLKKPGVLLKFNKNILHHNVLFKVV